MRERPGGKEVKLAVQDQTRMEQTVSRKMAGNLRVRMQMGDFVQQCCLTSCLHPQSPPYRRPGEQKSKSSKGSSTPEALAEFSGANVTLQLECKHDIPVVPIEKEGTLIIYFFHLLGFR